MQPLVSVIIPTFNRAHLIGETLDSVLAQTYQNWECIVVDDGSTDNTREVIQAYCAKDIRFNYHKRPDNRPKGANACRNYGFELSKGEYVNWFDSDDLMLPKLIDEVVSKFTKKLQLIFVGGYVVDDKLIKIKKLNVSYTEDLYSDFILWKQEITTNSIFFKKQFLINKHLFNVSVFRGQETDFFSRLFFELPLPAYTYISNPLYLYRQHTDSKTFEGNRYNNLFKSSESFVYVQNFKKSKNAQNQKVFNFVYKALLNCFFKSLDYQHKSNARYILKNLVYTLITINFFKSIEILIIGNALLYSVRGRFRLRKKWLSYKFRI